MPSLLGIICKNFPNDLGLFKDDKWILKVLIMNLIGQAMLISQKVVPSKTCESGEHLMEYEMISIYFVSIN